MINTAKTTSLQFTSGYANKGEGGWRARGSYARMEMNKKAGLPHGA